MAAGVSVVGVDKRFGETRVLQDVSLDIAPGEFLTLVGPSGCGKSTLLRIIAGLDRQDRGSVLIAGRPVDDLRPKARDVAMVFQSYALYPHMTVAQNLALPLSMRRLSRLQRLPLVGTSLPGARAARESITRDVRAVADALDIAPLLDRKPRQLSGGQRQRVALGRAMVRQPAVFLMDEPLSNLDASLRVQTRAEIKELHARLGATFVYVTHDQAEAMTMSDRVAVMIGGRIVEAASPVALYEDPSELSVARFIGSPRINALACTVTDEAVVGPGGLRLALPLNLAPATAVTLAIRPEHVHLVPATAGALTGRVRLAEYLGADLFVHAAVDGAAEPVIARVAPQLAPEVTPGSLVHLSLPQREILVFDADGRRHRPDDVVVPLRQRSMRP